MATGAVPDPILLEDLIDLAAIVEATGRTVRRVDWAEECQRYAASQNLDALF